MLKRSDLVKQFDLVVKQEIVNHNRAIEATNQALRDITIGIENLNHALTANVAKLESRIKGLEIDIRKELDLLSVYTKKQAAELNDVKLDNERIGQENRRLRCAIEELKKAGEDNTNVLGWFRSSLTSLNDDIYAVNRGAKEELALTRRHLLEVVRATAESLEKRPVATLEKQSELEKKIREKNVDIEGVGKEFKDLKARTFYAEKKIEDLYALLGRKINGGK